jgi:hypothetical protein
MVRLFGQADFRLRFPIETDGSTFGEIAVGSEQTWISDMTVTPRFEETRIVGMTVRFVVEDERARVVGTHAVIATIGPMPDEHTYLIEPGIVGFRILRRVLSLVAALTLQAELLREIQQADWYLTDQSWEVDGNRKPLAKGVSGGPWLLVHGIRDTLPLSSNVWTRIPDHLANPEQVPLWRIVLVDAYEALWRADLIGTVLRAATAMELGVARYLPGDFNMEALRAAPIDLERRNGALFANASQLWYSRHGIIHRGHAMLYERHPRAVGPLRALDERDVRRFLEGVPEIVRFVEQG